MAKLCVYSVVMNPAGKITLKFLGSGTIRSESDRTCTALYLHGPGLSLLIDCGPGTLYRLKQLRLDPPIVENIFITHFHPDHVSDLISLLFLMDNTRSPENPAIRIWGPPGFAHFVAAMQNAFGDWLRQPHFQFRELPSAPVRLPGLTVRWRKVHHNAESVGYRFETATRVAAFSGDSGPCPELPELCNQADLAILECAFPDTHFIQTHLTPSLAGELARESEVKRLILTHLYPETLTEDVLALVRKKFNGPVHLAKDLDEFDLCP